MNRFLGWLAVITAAFFISTASAQEGPSNSKRSRPINSKDFSVDVPGKDFSIIGLHAESNFANGELLQDQAKLRFYYLPPVGFLTDADGKIMVTAEDNGDIVLHLMLNPKGTRELVRNHLVTESVLSDEGISLSNGQVQAVSAAVFSLRTGNNYTPALDFGARENYDFTSTQGVFRASTTPELAKKFVKDLRAGSIELTATIVFKGYAYEQSSATVSFSDMLQALDKRELMGDGALKKVSRHYVSKLMKKAFFKGGVYINTEFDSDIFDSLVGKALAYFKREAVEVDSWEEVDAQFEANQWDANDLKAAVVKTTETSFKHNEVTRKDLETVKKGLEGGGDLNVSGVYKKVKGTLNLDGKASKNSYKERLRSLFSKWGLTTKADENGFSPKTLDVYKNQVAELAKNQECLFVLRKNYASDGLMTFSVHPKTMTYTAKEDLRKSSVISEVPVGTITMFAGTRKYIEKVLVPQGWMMMEGQSLARDLYPELFAALGVSYGASDKKTFCIPDARGIFLRSVGKEDKAWNPDHLSRGVARNDLEFEKGNNGRSTDTVGSRQYSATSMPIGRYKRIQIGANGVRSGGIHVWFAGPEEHKGVVNGGIVKNHLALAGNHETRPSNMAVYSLIKVRPSVVTVPTKKVKEASAEVPAPSEGHGR